MMNFLFRLYACIGTGDGRSVPAAFIEEKFARHGTGLVGCTLWCPFLKGFQIPAVPLCVHAWMESFFYIVYYKL